MSLATAEKLQVLAAPGCTCPDCVFIRQAYACCCACCGRGWQAAFATVEAAQQAMAVHAQDCAARRVAQQKQLMRQRRPPRPAYVPTQCGWCGASWPARFTTVAASQRFLRGHTQGCYLHYRQERANG
jgi:hypothetical protein